jgi:hypothetical protein
MKKSMIYIQWGMIAILGTLVILLLLKTNEFRKKSSSVSSYSESVNRILQALKLEKKLKKDFLFHNFPIDINPQRFYSRPPEQNINHKGLLLMIFDFTVCGKCLYQELEVVNEFKDWAYSKNISIKVIAGVNGKKEESEVLALYRSGQMPFPFEAINVDSMYEKFNLDKNSYLDTPFFVYTTVDYNIMDIFKPVYLETRELRQWLDIILN